MRIDHLFGYCIITITQRDSAETKKYVYNNGWEDLKKVDPKVGYTLPNGTVLIEPEEEQNMSPREIVLVIFGFLIGFNFAALLTIRRLNRVTSRYSNLRKR